MINGSPTNLDTLQIDYLYDENGVPYGGLYRSPTDTGSPVFFALLTTDRGDVVELLDANGDLFAGYRYDAWGNPTGTWTANTSLISDVITPGLPAAIADRQVLRYASYVYDSESGLYYLSARSYDPATAQFISPDLAKADGEESAYQYCRGEPVGSVDPSGTYGVRLSPKMFADNTAYFKLVLRRDAGWARIGIGYAGTIYGSGPRPTQAVRGTSSTSTDARAGCGTVIVGSSLTTGSRPMTSATFTSATSALRCGFRRT